MAEAVGGMLSQLLKVSPLPPEKNNNKKKEKSPKYE